MFAFFWAQGSAPSLFAVPGLQEVEVLSQRDQDLDISQVLSLGTEQFRPLPVQNLGFDQRPLWLKVQIPAHQAPLFLALPYAPLDWVTFFAPGSQIGQTSGASVPLDLWPIPHRYPIFEIPPGTQNQWAYLKIRSDKALIFPVRVWDQQELNRHTTLDAVLFGALYGALAIMFLFNGLIYLSTGQKAYLYYLTSLVGFGLLVGSLEGFGQQYFWPASIHAEMLPFGATMALWGSLGFARLFLKSQKYLPKLDRVIRLYMASCWVLALAGLAFYSRGLLLGVVFWVLPGLLLVLATGLRAWRKQVDGALIFLGSWALYAAASLYVALIPLLRWPYPVHSELVMYLGMTLNLAFLSLALARQINRLKQEQEAAQRELLQTKENLIDQLQHTQETKDRFLASTSHELLTPLSGINGLVDIILHERSQNLDLSVIRDLKLVQANTARLEHLVSDILDFSKLSEDRLNLNIQPLSLWKCAEFVLASCRPLVSNHHQFLTNAVPTDFPSVLADERRLQQILFNLVENAIKYSEQGEICIHAIEEEEEAIIEVSDQGPGIPAGEWERLLMPFERGRQVEALGHPGTGLGLSLVNRLTELHQGKLSYHRTQGPGATLRFTLPYSQSDAVSPNLAAEAQPQTDQWVVSRESLGSKILVVEDEPLAGELVARILNKNGFQAMVVSSGIEALETVAEDPAIEMVLLDIMMPHMDGFEVCRRLRAEHSATNLPILFLTARTDVEDVAEGFESGGNDYITKPVRHTELLARVTSHLKSRQLVVALQENRMLQREVERRQRIEGLLKSMRTRLTRVLDAIPSPFLVFDHRGYLSFINAAGESCCGLELDGKTTLPFAELAPGISWDQAMAGKLPEISLDKKDGSQCRAMVHCLPRHGEAEAAMILTLVDEENPESNRWPVHLGFDATGNFLGTQDIKTRQETRLMPERLDGLQNAPNIRPQDLAEKSAELMNGCLNLWTQYSGKDKLQLAEDSGLWTVTAEASGTYRTRTLDRYLKSSTLPKRPRWRNVLQTAYFVRQHIPEGSDDRKILDQQLEQLEALLIHQ
ncbi:MAG: 7TM diverse intracellular signaling domain-containing protein [bacterium]|nr:7TM diverse intracellular signaling domain-containing protein [bacterium]